MIDPSIQSFTRRKFVLGAASACVLGASPQLFAASAAATQSSLAQVPVLTGNRFDLFIGEQRVNFTGRARTAITVNQSLPAPVLRWREGERVKLRVHNQLREDSSIHWHGIILPSGMDGVPGLSFDGIKPGESFEYEFDLTQSGTYWYHSHSNFQEQLGLYGAIIVDPQNPDPVAYDRDMVVLLSDWSDSAPDHIYATLKKQSHYYNRRERTVADLWRDLRRKGLRETYRDRAMWNRMRMSDRDISDVSGYTYTYLMNGVTPDRGWVGVFEPGQRLRLRFINGSAMTLFDVRIPGLKMTVVAADGQNVKPVVVDEFRIGAAETYDVMVEPAADRAYTLFAQSIDRSGYARGTLTPDPAWLAEIPAMDPAPVLGHVDMGMLHGEGHQAHGNSVDHGDRSAHAIDHQGHSAHATSHEDHSGHFMDHTDHSAHDVDHSNHDMDHSEHIHHRESPAGTPLAPAGFGGNFDKVRPIRHAKSEFGPQVDMRVDAAASGLKDPGVGLRDHQRLYGRRVLTYADLKSLHPTRDRRQPTREIELHLTGNMHRYMWSVNGLGHAEAPPIVLQYGERVRFVLINDTMMTHPFHLHGLWSELETGDPDFIPRKHTVLVQPGSRISYLVTADARGRWAYHCHLLYHMRGMMREVRVL
jgi:CopA family copper-resistance protein